MAKTVWKYSLGIENTKVLLLPKGAVILDIQVQGSFPELWAFVDPDETEKEERTFLTFNTGQPVEVEDGGLYTIKHIATYQSLGGKFIGHVFELILKTE